MKKILGRLLAAAMLLTACGQTTTPGALIPTQPPTTSPAPSSTLTSAPRPTATALPTLAPTATAALPTSTPAVTQKITTTPASLFAPVTDADWQIGPANARVTIVEYSDFQ